MTRTVVRRISCLAALLALALPGTAHAKLSLQFDRASARAGDRVSLEFGEYFTSTHKVVHVYLVRAPILGNVIRPTREGGLQRLGPPPRLAGVHKVGRTLNGKRGIIFRVPAVRPGRYAAVIWCSTCAHPYLLAAFQGGIPEDASIRPTRALLRVLRS